jgi:hypothetical protein
LSNIVIEKQLLGFLSELSQVRYVAPSDCSTGHRTRDHNTRLFLRTCSKGALRRVMLCRMVPTYEQTLGPTVLVQHASTVAPPGDFKPHASDLSASP